MNNAKKQLTALCCASASGSLLHPMIVFPGNGNLSSRIQKQFPEAVFKSTPDGKISSDLFIMVIFTLIYNLQQLFFF